MLGFRDSRYKASSEKRSPFGSLDIAASTDNSFIENASKSVDDGPIIAEAFNGVERPDPNSEDPFPSTLPPLDRGVRAWSTVLGGFCGYFVTFGWITSMGTYQQAYQNTVLSTYSPSSIAWIVSLEAFMMYFNGFWIGLLFDNFGPRPLILSGSLLHIAGIIGASFGTAYWHFIIAQSIVSPLGTALIFYPCVSCVVTCFDKHRGLALGIAASGASLGGVVFPILLQSLMPRIGFGWAMRANALLILVFLAVTNIAIRPHLPPKPRPFVIKEFIQPLGDGKYFTLCTGAFLVYFGLFIPYNFLPLQSALNPQVSSGLAQYMIVILNGASAGGRILPVWLSDRVGRYNVNFVMTGLCSVLTLGLWLPIATASRSGAAPLIAYAATYGFVSGAFVAVLPALIAAVSSDIDKIGARTGTLFMTISFAALAGNPIAGGLLGSQRNEYARLIVFSGVFLGVGTPVLGVLRMWLAGWKWKIKI